MLLAFGSDAPVESLNPWLSIHAAVTRQRPGNIPPAGWYPEQRLSVEEALWGFTVGAAIAAGAAGPLEGELHTAADVHGESGLVVPPQDRAALAAALTLILDDPALAARLSAAARRRAVAEVSSLWVSMEA